MWEYDEKAMQFVFRDENGQEIYYFGLNRCETSAQVLDWLFQIHGKNWGRDSIPQLMDLMMETIHPQQCLCTWGEEQGPVGWTKEMVKENRSLWGEAEKVAECNAEVVRKLNPQGGENHDEEIEKEGSSARVPGCTDQG